MFNVNDYVLIDDSNDENYNIYHITKIYNMIDNNVYALDDDDNIDKKISEKKILGVIPNYTFDNYVVKQYDNMFANIDKIKTKLNQYLFENIDGNMREILTQMGNQHNKQLIGINRQMISAIRTGMFTNKINGTTNFD